MLSKPKSREVSVVLAFAGIFVPGLHKFYLGQPVWGVLYLLLFWTPIPKIASAIEGVWYLSQSQDEFNHNFNLGVALEASSTSSSTDVIDPVQVSTIADALRQLDSLRQEGLISEYEFEQKRRQLLDRIV